MITATKLLRLWLNFLCCLCAAVGILFAAYAINAGVYWFGGVCGAMALGVGLVQRFVLNRPDARPVSPPEL